MTPAELRTTREAVGLSVPQLAGLAGVQERTVRYWETGHSLVPADVAALVTGMDRQLDAIVQQALKVVREQSAARGAPVEVVLLRYREDQDLWRYQPEMRGMPVTTHAAMLHRLRRGLADQHMASRIVYLVPQDYQAWLGRRPDSEATRAEWAGLQVPVVPPEGQP